MNTGTPTALHERHQTALSTMLRRLLRLRHCEQAWSLLLHANPVDAARMLFCAEKHHISGRCQTKASSHQLTYTSDITQSALSNLASLDYPTAQSVDTLWYYVPYRSYDTVSVGTVISENEDITEFLTLNQIFRHTRYARDDLNGDFLTLHVNPDHNFVEAFYLTPKSTTERSRALIRFDYDAFTTATSVYTDPELALSALLRAVSSSHLVVECRQCPFCNAQPSTCNCKLTFYPPNGPFDYAQNAKNMLDMVGDYLGIAYHYVRETQFLGEFFNTCSLSGGIGSVDRAQRLFKFGMQYCLSNVPTTIMQSPIPLIENTTPPTRGVRQDPAIVGALSLPTPAFPVDESLLLATDSNIANSEFSDLSVLESSPGYVPQVGNRTMLTTTTPTTTASIAAGVVDVVNVADIVNVTDVANVPIQQTLVPPLFQPDFPSPIVGLPVPIQYTQQQQQQIVPLRNPPLPKATVPVKKPRGRRPRPPPKRLTKLVKLAPAGTPRGAVLAAAAAMSGGGDNTLYEGFPTEEALKAHKRKLRSRESAAKSNERRRNKRIIEEQQKKIRAEAQKQQLQQQKASS